MHDKDTTEIICFLFVTVMFSGNGRRCHNDDVDADAAALQLSLLKYLWAITVIELSMIQ